MKFARKAHRIRLATLAVSAVLIPVFAVSAGTATAAAPATAGHHQPKPTIVLVHGAWADASSWSGEIRRLQHDGYTVTSAPNPLRGLDDDSAYLEDFLSTVTGPIILVGHSYGGAVITNAATGNPNVKALVYVDAFVPDQNESITTLIGANSFIVPALTDPTSVFNLVPYPGAPAGQVDTYLRTDLFITKFANGVPRAQAAVLAAAQSPASTLVFQPTGVPAWRTIPSYDLIGLRDNAITPDSQRMMAARAHATTFTFNAGHLGLISDPGTVTQVIETAARDRG
ncbi:MAG TPA: alpha/beta hydrolase [Pseudonocardiaceae bacterium]|nr:alpha/beta hydrolase [Pseudonocardiaceae bacterium]